MRALGGEQKPYVDTGPVLEKPIAALAGLGWQGKSTILINRPFGTWLFLATVFTTLDIAPDKPESDKCGSCSRCIDACPTRAIVAPYQLDARRCISYLTIEHDGPIPDEFHEAIGDRVFGCDECLDVCPWNKWAAASREERLAARPLPPLRNTLAWTPEQFLGHFAGMPQKRLKLHRWLRNALVVLGNTGAEEDLPAVEALLAHEDPMVAGHAAKAAGRIRKKLTP
jgi:epoxyqueuosine reductase